MNRPRTLTADQRDRVWERLGDDPGEPVAIAHLVIAARMPADAVEGYLRQLAEAGHVVELSGPIAGSCWGTVAVRRKPTPRCRVMTHETLGAPPSSEAP